MEVWCNANDSVRLVFGDCRDDAHWPPDDSAIITDPPWGIAYKSGHNSSRKGEGAKMCRTDGDFDAIVGDDQPFDPAEVVLNFQSVLLWGGHKFYDRLPAGGSWLVWDKLDGKASFPSSSDCELAWISWKQPVRTFTHLWRGIMRDGEENVSNQPKYHPHQKPVALMQWCVRMTTAKTIFDPYMGSGTTGIAAIREGRAFVGYEVDPTHFQTSKDRIQDELAKSALLNPCWKLECADLTSSPPVA